MRAAACGATPWWPAVPSVPGCDARRHRARRGHGAIGRMHRAAARPRCRPPGLRRPPGPTRHGAQLVLRVARSRSVRHGSASRPLAREVARAGTDDASGDVTDLGLDSGNELRYD
jgi:hypothetical protein